MKIRPSEESLPSYSDVTDVPEVNSDVTAMKVREERDVTEVKSEVTAMNIELEGSVWEAKEENLETEREMRKAMEVMEDEDEVLEVTLTSENNNCDITLKTMDELNNDSKANKDKDTAGLEQANHYKSEIDPLANTEAVKTDADCTLTSQQADQPRELEVLETAAVHDEHDEPTEKRKKKKKDKDKDKDESKPKKKKKHKSKERDESKGKFIDFCSYCFVNIQP